MELNQIIFKNLRENKLTEAVKSQGVLEDKLRSAIKEYMMSEGFPEDEVDAYSFLELEHTEDGMLRIEVRAEISFDGLIELSEKLDSVVQEFDKDAYFDAVTSGIIEAYVEL